MPSSSKRSKLYLLPYLWLLLFFLFPFLIVLKVALSDAAISIPPYAPQLDLFGGISGFYDWLSGLDLENFAFIAEDRFYFNAYLSSLKISAVTTILCLIIGYPIAYAISRAEKKWQSILIIMIILPFWTSMLIRIYSLIAILSLHGYLNQILLAIGIVDSPLTIINTDTAVYIGLVYTYVPFMILPIYASLERIDYSLLEASTDLGSNRLATFSLITLPLSRYGVLAGCLLVFIPVIGEFVVPSILGGSQTTMIGKVLWEEFFNNRDWPVASTVAIILLFVILVPVVFFQRLQTNTIK